MGSRKKQLGATLLEALAALAIIGGVMVLANNLTNDYSTNQRSAVTAQYVTTVGNAAQAYIKDNYAALAAAATAAVPAVVTVPMLVSTNYLTTGFSSTNNQNQTACVLVLQPTANNLQALVITEGGNTIDDLTLGQIAATVGAAGGGIYSTATTTVKGAMGGWSFAVGNYANSATHCDGSAGAAVLAAGHPMEAIWFNNGSLATAYLYRNSVAGHPELNTMNTPLIMSSTQTTGTACTTTGAIAQDGSGAVISCQGGTWKIQGSAYWKDPVANFASLPACNASSIWQTRIAETPNVGTGPRAYTCNGATWQPIAVDDSGNMTIAGTATVGQAQINTVVVENTACPSNGLVARDATGLLLSCQSGVWKRYLSNGYVGNNDLNTALASGVYRFDVPVANGPGFHYGQLIVMQAAGDTITQIAGDYATGNLATRSGNPPSLGGGGGWTAWKMLGGGGFGGMYSYPAAPDYAVCGTGSAFDWRWSPNPKTGGYSCPAGFNDSVISKATYCRQDVGSVGYEVHMCWN